MVRIKDEKQYEAVMSRIDELLQVVNDDTPEDNKYYIELDVLSSLVEEYENIHYPVQNPSLPETIKLRMAEMNLNQSETASLLGISKSKISEILSGKAEPTLDQARRISRNMRIPPAVALGV